MLGRTAIVISPLIALMQDQAAQLAQMGIPAAVLNSSLSEEKQNQVIRKAAEGEYPVALSFSGAAGAGGYHGLAATGPDRFLRHR